MITDSSTCSPNAVQASKPASRVNEAGPRFEILSLGDYLKMRIAAPELILGATIYSSGTDSLPALRSFEVASDLPPLEGKSWVEVLHFPDTATAPAITRSTESNLRLSLAQNHLFGIREAEVPDDGDMREATFEVYHSVEMSLRKMPHFHLWRCWNVIPSIHQKEEELDRYMQFCQGREEALILDGRLSHDALPAASAVGSQGRKLQISFIAGKAAGLTVENPEQVSAYRYPEQYGPASPSFSRSLLAGHQLWISGTASIAGHRSLHINNLKRQLQETAARIHTLIECAAKRSEIPLNFPASLKVFLRNKEDSDNLLPLLRSTFPEGTRFHLVEAEICREELLIEIEGVTS